LAQKIIATAHAPSYTVGVRLLEELADVQISARGLNKTAVRIGTEMVAGRDARTEGYFNQSLPRQHAEPANPMQLACVSIDGGRMQTRVEGGGQGVHHPHWRETKNGLFSRMKSDSFTCDPHPDLPACFADRKQIKSLLSGVGEEDTTTAEETSSAVVAKKLDADYRPQRLFRTCISSLVSSDAFGRMMEVEADSRGFYRALKKAFVSDGLAYNWTIQQRHFRDFTPILDFVHAVERLYEAARCVSADEDRRWENYLCWARWCWGGRIGEVIVELKQHQSQLGLPPKDCENTDPRQLLAEAIGYFENNVSRMKYPEYRQDGLPTTSALMESLVKEINIRVKGTEKFWNDGRSGEAILQVRAAALCDDDRLAKFLSNRQGHPFHSNVQRAPETMAT
jgi:hypothetical protein